MIPLTDRKLEVFIGSTKEDLKDAREAVIRAVIEAGHIPSGMELWSANASTTQVGILNHLDGCDVHIVILGARYGSFLQKSEISFTQWEFNKSRDAGRPVLAFLLEENEFKKALEEEDKNEVDLDKTEKERSKKAVREFRDILKSKGICRFFSNTEAGRMNLARLCSNAIIEIVTNRQLLPEDAGWMRASEKDAEIVRQVRKNPFLNRIIDRLHQFSTLTDRIVEDKEAKEALAKVFWEVMIGHIKRKHYRNIFFESGSTIAYVSDHFYSDVIPHILRMERWNIRTNNVLTLLQLILHSNIRVTPVPSAAPDPNDKYGAIFLPDQHSAREAFPLEPRRLFKSEQDLVDKLHNQLKNDKTHTKLANEPSQNQIFLVTTSGLDLDHLKIDFRGPHVGSHANMIFKRALFTIKSPVVLFINEKKLGDKFKIGSCFPIFGSDLPWKKVLIEIPLAICVGFSIPDTIGQSISELILSQRKKAKERTAIRIKEKLKLLGLDPTYAVGFTEKGGAIIAVNDAFKKKFPRDN